MEQNGNVIDFKIEDVSNDPLSELLKSGARKLIEQAIEIEVAVLIDAHKERKTTFGRAAVVRNGYLPERQIQTGIGPINVKIPKVRSLRGDPVIFRSALVPPYVRKTKALEAAIPWLYLKGVSSGEMGDALSVLVGPEAKGLSASVVSRLKQTWANEYDQWKRRPLDKEKWVYIWADGIYSGLKNEHEKLCALVIIGVTETGRKEFLAIEDGVRESTQSWREVLLNLKARGMNAVKLGIGDGALGFWNALEEIFPGAKHQRCWMHKTGNVLNELPKTVQGKAKGMLHDIWQADTKENAEKAFDLFVKTFNAKYPKATGKIEKDKTELLEFYNFPAEHWQSIRTSNPIESSFATIRQRTTRSKGCLTREGMLHMIFKLGMCAEKHWRRLKGFDALGKVITGIKFKDGIEVKINQDVA